MRIVNGYDSFGNTCGVKSNKKIGNFELSGQDTLDKPHLLFYDISELQHSWKVCVRECPNRTLNTIQDLDDYRRTTGVGLCKYGFDYGLLTNNSVADKRVLTDAFGPCPVLPIYERYPLTF